jgi:hypothetical protein
MLDAAIRATVVAGPVTFVAPPEGVIAPKRRHDGGVLQRLDPRRLGLAALVALALTIIGYGLTKAKTGDDNAQLTDPALEQQVPAPGSLVLRQSQVGVDLAPDYTGYLVIDGKQIPEDQYYREPALNQVFFTPTEGSEIDEFDPGLHTITAVFWKITEGEQAARTATWRFNVS